MSFKYFIQIITKNMLWLVLIPLLLAAAVFYFTRLEKKTFSSETVIYTGIASGYNLSGNNKSDFYSTMTAFDNLLTLILSRETKQQVAIKLLAEHLFLKKQDPAILSNSSFEELKKLIPYKLRKQLLQPTLKETLNTIITYSQSSADNIIYKILDSENPFYSLNALQKIKAIRVGNSDLIKISYETNDAAICKHTLDLLTDAFVKSNLLLRQGETESVIAYFEKESRRAYSKLDSLEHIFLEFNKSNDIINYYEQTKAVADEKESLYALNHILEMDKMANDSALSKVNTNLKGRLYQILYGTDVIKERENLSIVYNKIALNEIVGKNSTSGQRSTIDSLKNISNAMEKRLQITLTQLYNESNTPNGIPTKIVLDEWLKSTLAFEQSKAKLLVMDKRKKEFEVEYRKFAPIGAQLKTMDRQLSVAEQEYMEQLHGLSLARLAQQNNQLTSKLNLIDIPYLPLKPNNSTRILLVLIGFFAGIALELGVLLGYHLLNKSMQQTDYAIKKTGLVLLGIYPAIVIDSRFMDRANTRITQQLLSVMDLKDSIVIGVFSIKKNEGKSTLINVWVNGLKDLYKHVEYINLDIHASTTIKKPGIYFMEFSSLDETILSKSNMPQLDLSILVCNADKIWKDADKKILDILFNSTKIKPRLILNGLDKTTAQDNIGK